MRNAVVGLIVVALGGLPALPVSGARAATTEAAPDYAEPEAWLARPEQPGHALSVPAGVTAMAPDAARVDVFFVHPTTYLVGGRPNAAFDEPGRPARALDGGVLRYQASVFNGCCRIYAPRYRQASLAAFFHDDAKVRAALDLAYGDVERAFDRFIEADSHGRPFILAGHSQGSNHLVRLLQRRVIGTPLQKRLVAAYVIGASVPAEIERLGLPICDAAAQVGCLVVWNSVHRAASEAPDPHRTERALVWWQGRYGPIAGRPLVCVDPLDWRRDGSAPAAANLGALPATGPRQPLSAPLPALTGAACVDGLLQVDIPPDRQQGFRDLWLTSAGNYHVFDYNLFYMNLRANAQQRADAFLKQAGGTAR